MAGLTSLPLLVPICCALDMWVKNFLSRYPPLDEVDSDQWKRLVVRIKMLLPDQEL